MRMPKSTPPVCGSLNRSLALRSQPHFVGGNRGVEARQSAAGVTIKFGGAREAPVVSLPRGPRRELAQRGVDARRQFGVEARHRTVSRGQGAPELFTQRPIRRKADHAAFDDEPAIAAREQHEIRFPGTPERRERIIDRLGIPASRQRHRFREQRFAGVGEQRVFLRRFRQPVRAFSQQRGVLRCRCEKRRADRPVVIRDASENRRTEKDVTNRLASRSGLRRGNGLAQGDEAAGEFDGQFVVLSDLNVQIEPGFPPAREVPPKGGERGAVRRVADRAQFTAHGAAESDVALADDDVRGAVAQFEPERARNPPAWRSRRGCRQRRCRGGCG